jgi:hypothetical protein
MRISLSLVYSKEWYAIRWEKINLWVLLINKFIKACNGKNHQSIGVSSSQMQDNKCLEVSYIIKYNAIKIINDPTPEVFNYFYLICKFVKIDANI